MGLSTGTGAKKAQSVLYWPIFSGPVDCGVLVNSVQDTEKMEKRLWLRTFPIPVSCVERRLGSNDFGAPCKVRSDAPKSLVWLVFLFDER